MSVLCDSSVPSIYVKSICISLIYSSIATNKGKTVISVLPESFLYAIVDPMVFNVEYVKFPEIKTVT